MSRKDKDESGKELVRKQFLHLIVLQQKINILNHVNAYHEEKNIIGSKVAKIRFHSYMEVFDEMMYESRYTVLLEDDSMIFLFYEFDDNDKIVGHVLTYLPNFRGKREPTIYDLDDEDKTEDKNNFGGEDDELEEIDYIQLHKRISNFVRVDFEELGRKEFYHSLIHMHIGTEREALRIPIEHCVLPFEFLFFILKYIYQLPDEELKSLECEMSRESMLTEKETEKLKLVFSNCIR